MSADLFAEFESFSRPQPQLQRPVKDQTKPPSETASFASDPFSFATSGPANRSNLQTQAWPSIQKSTNNDPWAGFSSTGPGGNALKNTLDDDDDGWGDFESAEAATRSTAQPAAPIPQKVTPLSTQGVQQNPPPRRRMLRAPTIELMTNSLIDIPGANTLPRNVRSPPWMRQSFDQRQKADIPKPSEQKPSQRTAKASTNVLFDADDFGGADQEDDDEFGDFETVASPSQAPKDLVSDDLLTPPATARRTPAEMLPNLSLYESTASYPKAPKSPSFQDRNPFPGLALNTPIKPRVSQDDNPKTSPVTAWPSIDKDSAGSIKIEKTSEDSWDWDSFDTKDSNTVEQPPNMAAQSQGSNWTWDAVDTTNEIPSQLDGDKAPPINVPPPSVLMSIFPQLLGQANQSLYKPVGGQAFSIKNRILSDPKTIEFLRGYLVLAVVAAHIIAGRKLRWHRDRFLSQGMSISAAGSKGMKLAGVDKTQAAREDREASDILDLWKEHVGRLRSSVAAANSSIKNASEHLKIPDLRETMQVQTAKSVATAPKVCSICGLKRDERVSRVDLDIEDSFGEWWVDHWGHAACRRFWLKHESLLRQR
ncbi:hypothetical protein BJ170DRAFT_668896 [Xylariales sp. AK1849]|nr:hypothetical protein BJ170DRAFT_668896 [Xylariales sp. AK1849]